MVSVVIIDKIWNTFVLKYKRCNVGNNLQIFGRLYVHGRKNGISIGNNCVINSCECINPIAGEFHTHLAAGNTGTLVIGDNVGISQSQIISYNNIRIGNNVTIGSGCKIWDTDFHSLDFLDRLDGDSKIKTKPIIIGDGAFIGSCTIILKGVCIGDCSVIGAGSVVTKNVPNNELWAGNPARFIKMINI